MEQVTVCLTQKDTDYATILEFLKNGLNESGSVSPALTEFVALCIEQFELGSVAIPRSSEDFDVGKLRFRIRPRLAVVEMHPPSPNFRDRILTIARESSLTALDSQNGYLFIPPTSRKRPWWRFC